MKEQNSADAKSNSMKNNGFTPALGELENSKIIRSIWKNTFDKILEINIPESITSIGEGAFYGCDYITNIIIPNTMTTISDITFYDCSRLRSVIIGNNVSSIGNSAFAGCTSLISITLPNSRRHISHYMRMTYSFTCFS